MKGVKKSVVKTSVLVKANRFITIQLHMATAVCHIKVIRDL